MTTGPYAKLSIEGTIDGVQGFSMGLSCQAETTPTAEDLIAWLPDIETPLAAWWVTTLGPKAMNKSTCIINTLKAYGYAEIGTPSQSSASFTLGTALPGNGTAVSPTQCALVVTLKTAFTGRHNTGRFYMPATAAGVGTANRLNNGQPAAVAGATATLLHALGLLTINGTTSSAVFVPSSGAAQSRFVTAVEVGDVIDTQRRRRDQYKETYAIHAVT